MVYLLNGEDKQVRTVFGKRAQVVKPIFPFLKPTYLVCPLNKERSVLGISLFFRGVLTYLLLTSMLKRRYRDL